MSTAKFRIWAGNAFLFVLSLLLVFVVCEVVLDMYLLRFSDTDTFLRYASYRQLQERFIKTQFTPHRYLGFYPTPNYSSGKNSHNSLGFRGHEIEMPKPANRFRIVCIGGSTTYTISMNDHEMSYPSLLERYLAGLGYDVDVVNAGASGWSTWESLVNFEFRVLELEPDLIIVNHGINDIHARLVWPPSAYKGDSSGSRSPNAGGILMPGILEYSTLFRIAMVATGLTDPHAAFEKKIDRKPDTYYGDLFRKQKLYGTYPEGIFRQVPADEMLRTNRPVYFESNIRNLVAVAKSRKITVVLSSFTYSPLFAEYPRASSPEYVTAYNEMNALLAEIARETESYFFDLEEVFPDDRNLFVDGRHVTEEGVRLKSRLFGDFLINYGLLPEPKLVSGAR